jgi:DNA (cytosine-5)-methyltransferase 1
VKRPTLIDLFCKAGGAGMGYHRAGFEVIGVDIEPQPRYPFEFVQGDALALLPGLVEWYRPAAVHASPPCQAYSPLNALPSTKAASEHPDLVAPTRAALQAWGGPFVIENVMAAPLDRSRSIVLCGCAFGLRTYRKRRFEAGGGLTLTATPCRPHTARTASSRRRERWDQGWHVSITGDVGTYLGPEAMGINWMTGNELSQAIPPAYTQHIGEQLMAHVLVGAR